MSSFTNCGNLVLCPQILIGCMWKESVASVTTGLHWLGVEIYDIQSSYFCDRLYFMPDVSMCWFSEGTDNVWLFWMLTVVFVPFLPLPTFPENLIL